VLYDGQGKFTFVEEDPDGDGRFVRVEGARTVPPRPPGV
jgi:hypothetical protein